ncbi:mgc81809 protein [Grosmannia clavigera kw1407]|uniref:Mgc81809 protein n=1 Tax=Grosmannia clavigera (strain kw1407 / UAMH 11150) TaxID=655863 RepID=F0XT09_GROCL|nr:mgc81809 protein [Grosmannia clavigera kw1407]EFW99331.1 mgc81809 protein [Grosmannia clavigera kw1407]
MNKEPASDTTRHALSPPLLHEVAAVLATALPRNYRCSSATVVECPDLRTAPFGLAAAGLSGRPTVADVGGQGNLFPTPRRDKNYGLVDVAARMQLDEQRGALLGAGAGPNRVHGINSELAASLSWQGGQEAKNITDCSRSIRIAADNHGHDHVQCVLSGSTECALMANLYGSLGLPGPVLRVTARGRHGNAASFPEFLRATLHDAYGPDRQVSLGGVFLFKTGRARFHVMPDFPPASALPFADRQAVERWLTFHDFAAPIVCLSVFHSADPHQLGLRIEHTHGFAADRPAGGHYHYDHLARDGHDDDEVEYEAYFNVADALVQIDPARANYEGRGEGH